MRNSPKVSRASRLHVFEPEELRSILSYVIQTLQTPPNQQGTSFATARTEPRPYLTTSQGEQGISGNPTLLTLISGGLGTVSTTVPGSVIPGDTPMRTEGINDEPSDDS